ncbi:MAG: ThuA domain-containing protein, partial [Clostridia bacterium]|nr:ThuA domain-containing protein [Clostridia bacterium]
MIKVLVWNEFIHEKEHENIREIYPDGIHNTIADFLRCDDIQVSTATLDDENCGITPEILDDTDVLIWWGHAGHHKVPDEIAKLVQEKVLDGMGFI